MDNIALDRASLVTVSTFPKVEDPRSFAGIPVQVILPRHYRAARKGPYLRCLMWGGSHQEPSAREIPCMLDESALAKLVHRHGQGFKYGVSPGIYRNPYMISKGRPGGDDDGCS